MEYISVPKFQLGNEAVITNNLDGVSYKKDYDYEDYKKYYGMYGSVTALFFSFFCMCSKSACGSAA